MPEQVIRQQCEAAELAEELKATLKLKSITLRKALTNVTLASERGDIFVPKGTYIGTLLSVTNTDNETLRYRQQRHQPKLQRANVLLRRPQQCQQPKPQLNSAL